MPRTRTLFALILVFYASTTGANNSTCPQGYTPGLRPSRCFLRQSPGCMAEMGDCVNYCAERGGTPACPESYDELAFIYENLGGGQGSKLPPFSLWTGIYYAKPDWHNVTNWTDFRTERVVRCTSGAAVDPYVLARVIGQTNLFLTPMFAVGMLVRVWVFGGWDFYLIHRRTEDHWAGHCSQCLCEAGASTTQAAYEDLRQIAAWENRTLWAANGTALVKLLCLALLPPLALLLVARLYMSRRGNSRRPHVATAIGPSAYVRGVLTGRIRLGRRRARHAELGNIRLVPCGSSSSSSQQHAAPLDESFTSNAPSTTEDDSFTSTRSDAAAPASPARASTAPVLSAAGAFSSGALAEGEDSDTLAEASTQSEGPSSSSTTSSTQGRRQSMRRASTSGLRHVLGKARRSLTGSDAADAQVSMARLHKATLARSAIRMRVSVTSLVLGWILSVISITLCSWYGLTGHTLPKGFDSQITWDGLTGFGMWFFMLALLPTDRAAIRFSAWCLVGFFIYYSRNKAIQGQGIIEMLEGKDQFTMRNLWAPEKFKSNHVGGIYFVSTSVGTALLMLYLLPTLIPFGRYAMSLRASFDRQWRTLRLYYAMGTVLVIAYVIGVLCFTPSYVHQPFFRSNMQNICANVLGFVASGPRIRGKVQSFLQSLGTRDETRRAAAVAGLLGSRGAKSALKLAESRFSALPFSALSLDDYATNKDTGLHSKTVSVALGGCDAFHSHSWSDNAEVKWLKVCEWVAEFKREHRGRDPLIWLDKACINQQAIEESLAGLPVYLAGCQTLLITIGQSYPTRLWCCMEIFTFTAMGGSADRVCVKRLDGGGGPSSEADDSPARLTDQLHHRFDVRDADCYLRSDKERLLGVIDAAYGDVQVFNHTVRGLFRACMS